MSKTKGKSVPFPTREELLAYIRESPTPVTRKEIARAFQVRGADRGALKDLLRELQHEGEVGRGPDHGLTPPERLPAVQVIEVTGLDADGEVLAKPAAWRGKDPPPPIYLVPERRAHPALTEGDRVLARLRRLDDGSYEARPIRVLGGAPRQVLGIYEPDVRDGRLRPTDRRAKSDFVLKSVDAAGAAPGELVLAEIKAHHPRLGLREVRVVERLGGAGALRALSLIAIHEFDIPTEFPRDALEAAAAAGPVTLDDPQQARREDLRDLPLVTIDGADARDFDDAVWAAPDDDPKNPGGWRLLVAIADVAHYVRPDAALDRAAYERGNSVYFPDRVVPMLPEALSNGWCSLVPGEDRPCLAVRLTVDAEGTLKQHRFLRGLMRSAARLTYEQVQEAQEGRPDAAAKPLLESVIAPLYGAFHALARGRAKRGVLELDLPEQQVLLDDQGRITAFRPRPRLDSHRLIEEFMITANVAAAEALEQRGQPCMYRVHDAPDPAKLEALRQVLDGLGLRLARGQTMRPRDFNGLLTKVADGPDSPLVSELVLRAQAQAVYSPRNLGHFGLALRRYAHFTSPIRRYADLLVHRALIAGFGLGAGGLPSGAGEAFQTAGEHISETERRAQAAERDAMDRFAAAYLQERVGAAFDGRIVGVTRFGLFVRLDESGADGLVPIRSLPDDYYLHDAEHHSLTGRRWGRVYRLGERVRAVLAKADPITSSLVLTLEENGTAEDPWPAKGRGGRRRRA